MAHDAFPHSRRCHLLLRNAFGVLRALFWLSIAASKRMWTASCFIVAAQIPSKSRPKDGQDTCLIITSLRPLYQEDGDANSL